MDVKTLKKLNKNFDKTWEKLSFEEQKEIVDFMFETLKDVNDYFSITKKKIVDNYKTLNDMLDENTKEEIKFLKSFTSKLTDKKLQKEEKLQNEIMTTNNKQLLFQDIYSSFIGFDKATELLEKFIIQSNNIIKNGVDSVSSKTLTSLMVVLESLNETNEKFNKTAPNQIKKVKELFADYINENEEDLSL